MIRNKYIVVPLLLMLLAACASLGLPTPETFNERLAAGYGTVTQVRSSATQLLTMKKLTSADAQNIQTQADTARAGLDVAKTLSCATKDAKGECVASDMVAANNRLTMATTILTALQSYLTSRQR